MIDLHCHVLAGIDDGPRDSEGSLALARAAAAAGIDTLVATPHVNWRYANDAGTIARMVDELNARLAERDVRVGVRAGAEVALTHAAEMDSGELARLSLGGGPWLLIEPPTTPIAIGLEGMVAGLQARGHSLVFAHPERCASFHRDPQLLASLVRAGALCSITAGSLVGHFGGQVRRFSEGLLREGLVHNVTSDAHDHVRRAPGIRAGLERAHVQGELADWLTVGVPAAILAGDEIPQRPAGAIAGARRRWLRRPRGLGQPTGG